MKPLSVRAGAVPFLVGLAALFQHLVPAGAQALNPPPAGAPAPIVVAPTQSPAASQFTAAISDYRAGHLDRAIVELRLYLKTKPSDAIAIGLLGFLELKQGPNIAQATADLKESVKLDPKNIVNRNNLAIALVQQQKFAEAAADLEVVAQAQPNQPLAQARLADALAAAGDIPRALAIFAKVTKVPGCPPSIIENYALALARTQHYAVAAKQFDRVASLDPTDEQAWDSAGICYAKIKQQKDAVRCLGEALKLGPADPYRTRFLYATALAETGADEAASKQFQYVTVIKPDEFAGWYNLGLLDERLGHDDDAIAAYKQAHQLAPENASDLLNLCGLLVKNGQAADAVDQLTAAVQQQPGSAVLHAGLGSAYNVQNNAASAETEFKTALSLDPTDNITRAKLAQIYVEAKQWDDALAQYDLLAKAAPNSDSLQNQRGEALEQLKRYPEALAALQDSVQLNPKNAIAWNNLGAVHEQMNRYPEALTEYKKAAALDANLMEAKANVDRLTAFLDHGPVPASKPAASTSGPAQSSTQTAGPATVATPVPTKPQTTTGSGTISP